MTLYLLVVAMFASPYPNCAPLTLGQGWICATNNSIESPKEDAPRVDFFLSEQNAAKEYAAQPKGSARLFKIEYGPGWMFGNCDEELSKKYKACLLGIKELNVLPAQSYEVGEKERVEARP